MQHLIRQNTAISSHTENIGLRSLERLNNLGRHTISLNNPQPKLKRLSLNRRRLQLLTTPANSIRTSNYERNIIASLNKRSQRRHSKIRRTHKHNTHKGRLPSTKAETATNNSAQVASAPSRKNSSTRTNIPKTKERAAIKAALPTKQLSAKASLPGPRHPGETKSDNVVPDMCGPHPRDGQLTYSVSPGRAPRARASWYSLTALILCMGLSRSNMVLPCR